MPKPEYQYTYEAIFAPESGSGLPHVVQLSLSGAELRRVAEQYVVDQIRKKDPSLEDDKFQVCVRLVAVEQSEI